MYPVLAVDLGSQSSNETIDGTTTGKRGVDITDFEHTLMEGWKKTKKHEKSSSVEVHIWPALAILVLPPLHPFRR